eukprot:symbB.v1.2.029238.t1/scaffold3175.1/size97379/5
MERNQGWKCGHCKVMNKKNAEYCQWCGSYWVDCHEQQSQSWDWPAQSDNQTPRQRSSSARRRSRQKGSKGKGGSKETGGVKGAGGKMASSPFATSTYTPAPNAMTPWPTLDFEQFQQAPPTQPTQQSNQTAQELVLALKKAFPESASLPQPLREAMEKAENAGMRQVTKDLHVATSSLGRARRAHQEANEARSKLKAAWMRHLQESLSAWESQLDTYRSNMAKLQDAEAKALQEVANAKKTIQQLNSHAEGAGIEDTSLTEELTDAAQDKEEEKLRQQLQDVMTTCLSTVDWPKTRENKPNPGIIEDDDSVLPFRHRSSDGSVVFGRTIAPLNWARNIIFRTEAGNGAVYRDDEGELRVLVRTWIAAVRTQLILPHRDIVVRAQLFGEIEAKVRRAWRDQIGRRDSLTITAVRPSPNIGYSGQRPIHLLVELNRRRDSMMYPVLLAFREIDENGPSATIQWFPTLLASPVGTTTFHNVGAPPCGREQLLIPLPGRTRRWMQDGQSRPIHAGLFLPIWWDARLRPQPQNVYEEEEADDQALMQRSAASGIKTCRLDCQEERQIFDREFDDDRPNIRTEATVDINIPESQQEIFQEVCLLSPEDPDQAWTITSYGLMQAHYDTRSVEVQIISEEAIKQAMRELWTDLPYPANLYFVWPQPEMGPVAHVIAEFITGLAPPVFGFPTLRRVFENEQIRSESAYHYEAHNAYDLYFQAQMHEICAPWADHNCRIRLNGVPLRETLPFRLYAGSLLDIMVDPREQEEEEGVSFMQQGTPTGSDQSEPIHMIAHTFHMSTDYKLVQLELDPRRSLILQLGAIWKPRGNEVIVALHDVVDAPLDLQTTADTTMLVEMSQDALRKADETDCLILADLQLHDHRDRMQGIKLRKALWARRSMTRSQVLQLFSALAVCQDSMISCTVWRNKILWPDTDLAMRQIANGDYVHILIRSVNVYEVKEIYRSLCQHEQADGQRFIFHRSPSSQRDAPTRQVGDEEDQEDGEESGRSRSRTRSLSLLQLAATTRRIGRLKVDSEGKERTNKSQEQGVDPHVIDRWCVTPSAADLLVPHSFPVKPSTPVERPLPDLQTLQGSKVDPGNRTATGGSNIAERRQISIADLEGLCVHETPINAGRHFEAQFEALCNNQEVSRSFPPELQETFPPVAREWMERYPFCDGLAQDNTYIYTDGAAHGSFEQAQYRSAAYAVVIFAEDNQGQGRHLVGWKGGFVETDSHHTGYHGAQAKDAINAEQSAILQALLIVFSRRKLGLHTICFDNQAAGYGADGIWTTNQESDLAKIIRLLTYMMQQMNIDVKFQHVKAHSNHPQNDIVDQCAKNVNLGKLESNGLHGGSAILSPENLHRFILWKGAGKIFPVVHDNKLQWVHHEKAAEPNENIKLIPAQQIENVADQAVTQQIYLHLATYNVLTLRASNGRDADADADATFMHKASYLAQQVTAHRISIIGIQESRSRHSGVIQHDNIYRLIAKGTEQGTHGCELWFNLAQPLATIDGKPYYVETDKVTVLHESPTILMAKLQLPGMQITVGTVHAPQSGSPCQYREDWWKHLETVLQSIRTPDPIFIMGDFNATLPETNHQQIGNLTCIKANPNSVHLSRFLEQVSMWAPSTFSDCHEGSNSTWTHASGQASRLDYILVDEALAMHQCHSYLLPDLDAGNPVEDHQAVGLSVAWSWTTKCLAACRKRIDWHAISQRHNAEKVRECLANIPNCAWGVDIHDHMQFVQDSIQYQLRQNFETSKKPKMRPYITDRTWQIRSEKLQLRGMLRQVHREASNSYGVAKTFGIWSDRELKVQQTVVWVLIELFAAKQLRLTSRQLKASLKEDRDIHITNLADDIGKAGSAEIHQALSRLKGTAKQRKRGRQPLPQLIGKAPGPDGLRSDLCAIAAPELSRLLYPILVKQTLHIEEPIQARGGLLVAAYKGKGRQCDVESFRSLLLSNHLGKCMRGVYRPKLQPFYASSSSKLHFAAKLGGNVSHASHYLRSFHTVAKKQGWSSSSIFVDISSAFYRIIRQFAVHLDTPKEELARIFQIFNIPPRELEHLQHELNDRTALAMAETPERLQMIVRDYFEATWFTVPGSQDIVGTLAGSRPGDTFADLIFSFVFSKILDRITTAFNQHGWKTESPPPLAKSPYHQQGDWKAFPDFVQLTWADDLAVLQKQPSAKELVDRTSLAMGVLCDICWKHGLEPNFNPGKTEGMLHLRGAHSKKVKKEIFDQEVPELRIPSTLRQEVRLRIVAKYRHLGYIVTTGHKVHAEIVARIGQMRTAFTKFKKIVYGNRSIPKTKRVRILGTHVLSILRYNLGTWPILQDRDWKLYHGAVMSLYRVLARADVPEQQLRYWSDARVLAHLEVSSPQDILPEARLSYFASMIRSGPDELWSIAQANTPWYQGIEAAFGWLEWNTAGYHTAVEAEYRQQQWLHLIQHEPRQWKKWIKVARLHSVRQAAIAEHITRWYDDFSDMASEAGLLIPAEFELQPEDHIGQFACLRCRKTFKTKAGKSVHDFRVHNKVSQARRYLHGTTCEACHKQFFTKTRLQRHFYYSKECLKFAKERQGVVDSIAPGIGNRQEGQDRDLPVPVMPVIGPVMLAHERELVSEAMEVELDFDFCNEVIEIFMRRTPDDDIEIFAEDIRNAARNSIADIPTLLETLKFFCQEMAKDIEEIADRFEGQQVTAITRHVVQLFDLEWLLPEVEIEVPRKTCRKQRFDWWHRQKAFLWQSVPVEKVRSRLITFVHLYSGHRREGDVEDHLSQRPMPDGCILRCLSIDIIFDYQKGDLRNAKTQRDWLQWAQAGVLDGALMGPPCHTFSVARECGGIAGSTAGDGGPRVVRLANAQYGLEQVRPQEAEHLLVSNELLTFSLCLIVVMIVMGKWATLEHPKDKDEDQPPCSQWRASIWRIPAVQALCAHPSVNTHEVWQGLYGAVSPKPTTLLHTGHENFQNCLDRGKTYPMPTALQSGRHKTEGEYATAQLKAYPSALCKCIASSFAEWAHQEVAKTDTLSEPLTPFLQWSRTMVAHFNLERQLGRDFGQQTG